jgi:hypothetical protein
MRRWKQQILPKPDYTRTLSCTKSHTLCLHCQPAAREQSSSIPSASGTKRCQPAPRIFATVCPNFNNLRTAEQIRMKSDIGDLCRSRSAASHFPRNRTALTDTSRACPGFSQNTSQKGRRLRTKVCRENCSILCTGLQIITNM